MTVGRLTRDSLGSAFIAFAFVAAIVLHSGRLRIAPAFWGDLGYHRGVAYSMVGGTVHGDGPFEGLPSYYGGAFPLVLGWLSSSFGVSFDTTLSVVSWFAATLVPAAFVLLGMRLWPDDRLRAGALVVVATLATGVSGSVEHGWANGVLPASTNEWPLYPRDLALVLFVVALAICVRAPASIMSGARTVGAGVIVGATITVHLQIGLYGAFVLGAWLATQAAGRRRITTPALALSVAALSSMWWWLPRVVWGIQHGPMDLESRPGIEPSLLDAVLSLGWTCLLVPIALFTRPDPTSRDRFFSWWLAAMTPLLAFGVLVPDAGIMTLRRALFLAGIPLVVVASAAISWLVQRRVALAVLVVLAMAVTAASEAWSAYDFVEEQWFLEEYAFETYPQAGWSAALGTLRSDVRREGSQSVLVADPDGLYVWSQTGASPHSVWLPGFVKIGFDLESFTGRNVRERVRELEDAFQAGLRGLCALGRRIGADAFLLRTDGEGIATHDLRPSAEFRPPEPPTDETDLRTPVGDGLVYRARQRQEVLLVQPDAVLTVPLGGSEVTTVEVHAIAREGEVNGTATLTVDERSVTVKGERRSRSLVFRFTNLDLRSVRRIQVTGSRITEVVRILGYEKIDVGEASGELIPGGAVLLRPDATCSGIRVEDRTP